MEASDRSIFHGSARCSRRQVSRAVGGVYRGREAEEQIEEGTFQGPTMLALLALPLLAVSARGQVGEEEEKHFKPDNTSSFLVTRWRIGACWRTSLRTWRGSTSIPTTSTGDHPGTAPGTFGQREEKRFDTSWRQQLLAVSKRVLSEQSNPLLLQKVFSVT